MSHTASPSTRTALVTGASSGIGKATALALVRAGFRVFGTSRRAEAGQVMDGIRMVRCDVTSDESVHDAVAEVEAEAGRIDVLVNNAGIGIIGGAEESSMAQIHTIFDTNVYGLMRMTKAVLPIMRRQKSGRIVNLSSVLGLVPAPFSACYCASKHAVEGYSEALDHELRTLNIRVILVEPGLTRSSFDQNSAAVDQPLDLYAKGRANALQWVADGMAKAETSEEVAETILRAVTAERPRLRYTSGRGAGRLALLRRYVPAAAFDKSLRKEMRLP